MNTRLTSRFLLAAALFALPLINGCTQQSASNQPPYVTTSNPPPPPVVTQVVPASFSPAEPVVPVTEPAAPEVAPLIISNPPPTLMAGADPVVPANLRISKPLGEVIRLAQSGVDEMVILTYITNTTTLFTLGAEEIVYLNDLGVTGPVVTAMMHRDQSLKYAWATAGQSVAQSNVATQETVAVAPTYVNAPQSTQVIAAPEVQYVNVSNDYFYDSLTPYGSWVEVDGYGRCWRPTVAVSSSGWQPYRDRGRWVYTDSGWYWMSDYSWGSVAFHYGRWFSHPRWGWCWWPDNVWAPSWVTWRYDNDNCGWAPLPPRSYFRPGFGFSYHERNVGVDFDFGLTVGAFTFVPWGRFCDPYPYRYCLPRARSVAIYNRTTVINNVAVGNNNTIINRGISTDRVRERSRAEVRTVQIREELDRNARPRQEHLERDGRTLVVRRLPANAATAATTSAPANERNGTRRDAETRNDNRRSPQPAGSGVVTTPATPAAPFTPVTPDAPRSETATIPERNRRPQETVTPRSRDNQATVVRLPETRSTGSTTPSVTPATGPEREARRMEATPRPTVTPTPVRTPTPIFSKPLVVEAPAYTPTREVISGAPAEAPVLRPRNNSTAGRASSVWTAPTPRANPTISTPSYNTAPTPRANVVENPATSTPATPAYNRPNVEVRRENRKEIINRSTVNRPVERPVVPAYTPPAPRISAPVAAPTPAPRQSFTPAPAPSTPPPARTETRSEPRSETRSDSSRNPRNR